MPKHRGTVYTVIRERVSQQIDHTDVLEFDAVIGVYATISRAEEVAGAAHQYLIDHGAQRGEYHFTVKASTWYDE